MKKNNMLFIGGGNMAEAIISGMLSKGVTAPDNIAVFDISTDRCSYMISKFGIKASGNLDEYLPESEYVVLAIKPQVCKVVLPQIGTKLMDKAIISIVAGWTIAALTDAIGNETKILRVMPNTPALVNAGMSVLTSDSNFDKVQMDFAIEVFNSLGEVELLPESAINAVIGVSGSGPAYVYMFIEAMADAGVQKGLPRAVAYKLAAQTVIGAGKMVIDTNIHPGVLKDAVCSPGGTTIEAVKSLEESGLRAAVMNAVIASAEKAEKLN